MAVGKGCKVSYDYSGFFLPELNIERAISYLSHISHWIPLDLRYVEGGERTGREGVGERGRKRERDTGEEIDR